MTAEDAELIRRALLYYARAHGIKRPRSKAARLKAMELSERIILAEATNPTPVQSPA